MVRTPTPRPDSAARGRRARPTRARPSSPAARTATDTTSRILQRAVEEAARLLQTDGAMVYLLDPETGLLRFAHDAGIADLHRRRWVRRLELRAGQGMFGVAVAERRVVATGDYPNDRTFTHATSPDRFVKEIGLRSMVVAPLLAGGRVFGGLGTFSTRPEAFSDAQIGLVRALADHAAAAMANALLIEELDRSRAELGRRAGAEKALREIATRMTSVRESAEVIQQAVDEAARLLDAGGARIDLIDPLSGLLRWAYQSGADRPSEDVWPEDPDETLDQGVSGKAVTEGRVFFTGDYLADQRFAHGRTADGYIDAIGIRSVMAAPLVGEQGPFGALTVYADRRDAWREEDAGLLEALATEAAIAITNARLIEELGQSREALSRRAEAEQALREIAARITAIRDPSELLQHVVDEANRLVRADGTILDLLDSEANILRWAYDSGLKASFSPEEIAGLWIPVGVGITGIAVAEDRVITAGDDLVAEFPPSGQSALFFSRTNFRSLIAAPIVGEAGPLGVLEVYSTRPFAFDEADAALIRSLADQAAIAIQNARLIEALARSRGEIARRADAEQTLREIAARISGITDRDEILQQVVQAATRLLAASGAMMDLVPTDEGGVSFAETSAPATPLDRELLESVQLDSDAGVSGLALRTGEVQWSADYLADDRFGHTGDRDLFVERAGIRSVIAAPLMAGDVAAGTITVYSTEAGAFDEDDARVLGALAAQAAVTITNARLIEQLERAREEVERRADAERALRQIAANISAIRDSDVVLQQTINEASRLLRADGGIIDLLDEDAGALRWAYDTGMFRESDRERFGSAEVKLGKGIAGRAVLEQRVIRTGDYQSHEFVHTPSADSVAAELGIHSVIVAPIVGESGPVGAIEVYAKRPDAFDDLDAAVLGGLAEQAAIAIQNARLIEALNRSREENRRRADTEAALRRINASLSAIRDPDAILQQTVDEAKRLLDSTNARIDLLDHGILYWTYASGDPGVAARRHAEYSAMPVGTGVAGTAVARGTPFRTGDYLADDRFVHREEPDAYIKRHQVRSVMAVPLIGETGPLGALTVSSTQADLYTDAHAELLLAIADQAAIAIQNARLIEALERSREEIRRRAEAESALRRIAADISALRDPDAILQQTVDEARRLLDSRDARIDLVQGERLVWTYTSAASRIERWRQEDGAFGLDEGTSGAAVTSGRAFRTGDYLADPGFVHTPAADAFVKEAGFNSALAVPLLGETGPLGAISVASERVDAYDDEDVEMLEALANQAAIAIQNARLIEELERSKADLARRADTERALREMAARIADLRDPDELLRRVVEESQRLLGSDGAHLTRMSEDGTHVYPVVIAGGMDRPTEDWLRTQRFPLDGGINGLAAGRGEPVWTEDYLADPRIPREPDDIETAERLGLRGMAAVPLRAPEGGIIGTLAVSFRQPHRFDDDEIGLVQVLADHAAIALTNTSLYERVRRSESRYRHLVQNSPDLVWSVDAESRFTFISETLQRLTGWNPEELLGKHFGALVHESSADVARIDWTVGLSEEASELRGRVNLLHRDGHPVPAEFVAMGTVDADGRFLGANGSVRDMTELDRLEQELRASEARYRFLVENSPDVIFSTDADGLYTYYSESVERMTGWSPDELIGRHFASIVDLATFDDAEPAWRAFVEEPTRLQVHRFDLRRKDGSRMPVEVSAIGMLDERGRFAGIHGAARDVTEREALERELRKSEERYRFLVQNAPDIIFSTDREGTFTYLSETIERLTGWQPDDLVGRHFTDLVERESHPEAGSRWAAVVADPTLSQVVTLNLKHKDGGRSPFEISAVGIPDAAGRFNGLHGSARDVSDREALQRDLRRQAAELASGEERAHLARELHDSVTQALFSMTLTTRSVEMLVEHKPDAARAKLADLRELQREALAEMRALIFELRPGNLEQDGLLHALRTHAAALQGRIGLPIVVNSDVEDRLRLEVEQVFYRIAQEALHNVVKHASARQVRVELTRAKGEIRLRIEDDGKGFDPAAVPEGHLGLTGMRARAEKIGAELRVTSRPGSGTTIEVALPDPARRRPAKAARAAAPAE